MIIPVELGGEEDGSETDDRGLEELEFERPWAIVTACAGVIPYSVSSG
jgi:hypothetical protein